MHPSSESEGRNPVSPERTGSIGYTVSLEFETVSLPPFRDILVLAKKCPVGMTGISTCMGLMTPDGYELVEVEDPVVEALLIHKQIIKRLPLSTLLDILRVRVFPHISRGEIVRINLQVRIHHDRIEGTLPPHDH
ncbi:MAG: hypothetical protein HQL98_12380 [Magnetococcales bacterium]|nr:hypothetical protein [Magnetococcales bacterium]